MSFEEGTHASGRTFICGWLARAEDPGAIASRTLRFCRFLAEADPAYGEVWPRFGGDLRNPTGSPTVSQLTAEQLGEAIDRRGRLFEPPRWPAPVDEAGYSFGVLAYRGVTDPMRLGLHVAAGAVGPPKKIGVNNSVSLHVDGASWFWRDRPRALSVVEQMVLVWQPDWACAMAWVDENARRSGGRPWLQWVRQGAFVPNSPALDFPDAGPPERVEPLWGGDLRSWP